MADAGENELATLIVGAGPAGLTAAIELVRQGIEVLVVERREGLSALPRATVISTRSMELLRSYGLEQTIRGPALDVEWQIWLTESLAKASAGAGAFVGLPTREQSALVSPTAPMLVPQDQLEPVLLAHLRALGGEVAMGTELVALGPTEGGVTAFLRDTGSGGTRTVHARYVIAADGAHSRVRECLGITMHGPDRLEAAATALFHAPLWDTLGDQRYVLYGITDPAAPGTFLPAGRGDRWLYGIQYDASRERPADFTPARLRQLILRGAGVPDLPVRIERTGNFSFAAQMAERFRDGRVFLVGDAAHRVTPRGGTGMNTAIHDGHDLGWKLGWVLKGWAGPGLLDTYEAERRPVAEHNVARSSDPKGSYRDPAEGLHVDLGGRITHVWQPDEVGRTSTLDLAGPGLTVLTGPDGCDAWHRAASAVNGSPPVAVRQLDTLTARTLGVHGSGALLTRPDGVPAASWSTSADAERALRSAVWATVTSATPPVPQRSPDARVAA